VLILGTVTDKSTIFNSKFLPPLHFMFILLYGGGGASSYHVTIRYQRQVLSDPKLQTALANSIEQSPTSETDKPFKKCLTKHHAMKTY
jgi:hypothetical protein